MPKIRHVYIDGTDRSGFQFGVDAVTPVNWKFGNRIPKTAYSSYALGKLADNPAVQSWIKANKTVVLSLRELRTKLLELGEPVPVHG